MNSVLLLVITVHLMALKKESRGCFGTGAHVFDEALYFSIILDTALPRGAVPLAHTFRLFTCHETCHQQCHVRKRL